MANDLEALVLTLSADTRQIKRSLDRLDRDVNRSATNIEKRFAGAKRSMDVFAASVSGAGRGLLASLGVGFAAQDFLKTVQSVDSLRASLKAITGGSAAADREMKFIGETADRLGLELLSAGQAYSSLLAATQGTNLAGEETRSIFTAVAGAMSALGKSAADTEGALQAVQQMVSKGTVQAEELRGQLGERLPGAFRIAAESLGLTTAQLSKLLEKGGLAADDLLPRLADRLNELYGSDRRSTLVTEMNRLNNAVTELYTTIADVGALGLAIDGLSSLRDIVKEISVYTGLIGNGRIGDALALDADSVARMRLRLGQGTSLTNAQSAEWDSAFGMSGGAPTKVTVKPKPAFQPSGGTSKETLDAYERMTRMIQERTQALQYETSVQATLNPLVNDYGFAMEKARAEADLLNAAERAKIEITPEVRQNIDALATAYAEATVEAERLREQQEYLVGQLADLNDLGKDVLGGFISDMQNGVSAAEALSNALAKVGDKLLGMALDGLFNPVGSGPGGLLGSLLGSFGGSKAVGGPVNAGQIYRVGERGPEMFVPDVAGRIVPNHAMAGGGRGGAMAVTYAPHITVEAGASAEAVAQLQRVLAEDRRSFASRTVRVVQDAQRRNVRV
ncbi:phage tape measure protein [Ancylobacter novellus DSM 506]|uniref:Phage tape measure protein n=1 Tax=Ancylobacter novellus (strain ATCC 8093 / DSM 506 / JCM 20403 / CCM 1077 / IAM 12100 / NBRC 12443 / NCIMB 10456) TaxID=639283 RepID=D7A2T6_ANCN5|nr:tape measure protein [Ancylobacter novellus]ADH91616.1 phage tape measure protein [Ancylobacter novellus DSM 506]